MRCKVVLSSKLIPTFWTWMFPTPVHRLMVINQMTFLSCLVITILTWIGYTNMYWFLMRSKINLLSKMFPTFFTLMIPTHVYRLVVPSQITFLSSPIVTLCAWISYAYMNCLMMVHQFWCCIKLLPALLTCKYSLLIMLVTTDYNRHVTGRIKYYQPSNYQWFS